MNIFELGFLVYKMFLISVLFFSLIFYVIGMASLFVKPKKYVFRNQKIEWPSVTIQIPVHNDSVVVRCIEYCLKFDYPNDKFEIIVADDSSDETSALIRECMRKYPDKIRVFKRKSRVGFKAGALNNILKHSKGDIIVIFDFDFTPKKDFLRRIVKPFIEDEKIAYVQPRIRYTNSCKNLITIFATTFLMIQYSCIMPLQNCLDTTFFCGSGGAIRKDALLEIGGWNEKSLTEDADLSIRLLKAGYKSMYLWDLKASGELPLTFKGFINKHMRYVYGLTGVFIDHARTLWFEKRFSFKQKMMITFTALSYPTLCVFVFMAAILGPISWTIGAFNPMTAQNIVKTAAIFVGTSGFWLIVLTALKRENRLDLMKKFVVAALALGPIVAFINNIAILRALLGRGVMWKK